MTNATVSPVRNVDLLREVADKIEGSPHLYMQAQYRSRVFDDSMLEVPVPAPCVQSDDGRYRSFASGWKDKMIRIAEGTPCGTAHCVAGWAEALGGEWTEGLDLSDMEHVRVWRVARRHLGLTIDEATAVFHAVPTTLFPEWEEWTHAEQSKHMAEKLRAIADGEDVFDGEGERR